jgi:hypothetical protein
MLLLPFLVSIPRPPGFETSVILTNGHTQKLQGSARLAELLLSPANVFFHVADAFKGLPPGLDNYSDFQKLHLFFRLVIVAQPSEIAEFIYSRLETMKLRDIAAASFLFVDENAINTVGKEKDTQQKTNEDYTIFTKKPNKVIQLELTNSGITGEGLNTYTTAFTEKGIKDLITSSGGKIIHMIKIPSTNDKREKITILGVVFSKNH